MAASCGPTEQHWHPSSLLPYNALPNLHDDFDSILSNPKSTAGTGTDFYDRSLTSRRYALVGVAFSGIISCCCIATGVVILAAQGVDGVTPLISLGTAPNVNTSLSELLSLILNLLVTICTESTGFVHGTSLRSALASESRLRFNTNLRLLTGARGWRNPNGTLFNGIMAILLIVSYTSSSLAVTIQFPSDLGALHSAITGLPLLLLGIALLLQIVIVISGVRAVKILTWSSSPFDLTAALVHHTRLTLVPFRCMRGVSDVDGGPMKPSDSQPSAWHAHPSIRKVVISLWVLVARYAVWGAVVEYVSRTGQTFGYWFVSSSHAGPAYLSVEIPTVRWWIMSYINIAVVQGPLTLGLHCSELIANVIQNETQWRHATGRKGSQIATGKLFNAEAHRNGTKHC
ncbi:hypothetical protein EDB19DRAFT_1970748 [Suillus lakei]|nr:hypothetical protein EDB19DRAFT_1970748 [Suillus lakei]